MQLALRSLVVAILGLLTQCLIPVVVLAQDRQALSAPSEPIAFDESVFLTQVRQLTFDGARTGEGYFSQDGRMMVFQSEREPNNPFYQIYLMDRETGDVQRVSPGQGKTTCAWIHPSGDKVLFASTQFDPRAVEKQKAELEQRATGKQKRYAWDYDETYELIEWDRKSGEYRRLTDAVGYDAEASYSPDGQWIAFSSNRRAYSGDLSQHEKKIFEMLPASAADIYIMRTDGSQLKRLTDVPGYDGGPFFSPDGKRICWRRFNETEEQAEIFTMNIDGSDVRQVTRLGAMSWAPFYHPSGDYLIFSTNLHGFTNFEIYMVDADGKSQPVRVTGTEGFDALSVFSPDGSEMVWTSNRSPQKKSQLFSAKWNDVAARKALRLGESSKSPLAAGSPESEIAKQNASASEAEFQAADIGRHIDYLCRPELGGRLTGTEGEQRATAYVAAFMENLGLEPAGVSGDWYEPFPFTAGVDLGNGNRLAADNAELKLNQDWRPVAFSKTGEIPESNIVFAGYGLVAPKDGENAEYDSYVHLDVENKWVMVFRQFPLDVSAERKQHLSRYSSLRFKAMAARDRGAIGMIVVSGPTSKVRQTLVPLELDGTLSGTSLGVISVSDQVASSWLKLADEDLEQLQKSLDKGEMMMGIDIPKVKLSAQIDIQHVKKSGRNVLGWLRASEKPTSSVVIVGAHIDHLGTGENGSSLAKEDERGGIHRGADDNASGVAGMLEIAQYLAGQKKNGKLKLEHDVLFAAWSGEELGLIGSAYFAEQFYQLYPHLQPSEAAAAHASTGALYPAVGAAFNLDMIGRLRDNLILQGIGSSDHWTQEIERRNAVVGLPLTLQSDSFLPTDASTFYTKGVPILSAFTGSHAEYHTPRDVPETINYEGAANSAKLIGLIVRSVASRSEIPVYQMQQAPENQGQRAMLLASLGSIPDYAQGDIKGVKLSGVSPGGAAAKAGVKGGDIVVELGGKKIENIYDYTFAIEALQVGVETEIVVQRGSETLRIKLTPTSRQ